MYVFFYLFSLYSVYIIYISRNLIRYDIVHVNMKSVSPCIVSMYPQVSNQIKSWVLGKALVFLYIQIILYPCISLYCTPLSKLYCISLSHYTVSLYNPVLYPCIPPCVVSLYYFVLYPFIPLYCVTIIPLYWIPVSLCFVSIYLLVLYPCIPLHWMYTYVPHDCIPVSPKIYQDPCRSLCPCIPLY